MSSAAIASVMFGSVLAGTVIAMRIARRLPAEHLGSESRDVVKLGLGVIATLTALVLGLLVASTKGTYDAQSGMVKDLAAQMGLLDRVLARYGTETASARAQLHALAQGALEQLWPQDGARLELSGGQTRNFGEGLFETIALLQPKTDAQRMLRTRAQDILVDLGKVRQRLLVNNETTIPSALLWVLGVWQTVLFAGYGLIAPRNATTLAVLVVCMGSVSGALFLIMELDRPFTGLIRVSDAPLRTVISHLGE